MRRCFASGISRPSRPAVVFGEPRPAAGTTRARRRRRASGRAGRGRASGEREGAGRIGGMARQGARRPALRMTARGSHGRSLLCSARSRPTAAAEQRPRLRWPSGIKEERRRGQSRCRAYHRSTRSRGREEVVKFSLRMSRTGKKVKKRIGIFIMSGRWVIFLRKNNESRERGAFGFILQ